MGTSAARRSSSLLLAILGGIAIPGVSHAAALTVTEMLASDNGDDDGFADTNETVTLQIRVRNTTGLDLTGIRASLTTEDPARVRVTDCEADVGDLLAGQEVLAGDPFRFHVRPTADRTGLGLGAYGMLAAGFRIVFEADQGRFEARPLKFGMDLDLDVGGGAGDVPFLEDFELPATSAFAVQNLDLGRNSFAGTDGYRCQYNDPFGPNTNSSGAIGSCILGSSGHADSVFWEVVDPLTASDGGRAFSGLRSAHFGIDLGSELGWTTPAATLEAIRTTDPVHLAWDGAAPTLTFKHQASFVDSGLLAIAPPGHSVDRGVVMAQRADERGDPVGPWIKLYPYLNVYDRKGSDVFFNCMFDPVDDGSDEDDFFDPADPERRLGPSTTCHPEPNYSRVGATAGPFDPGAVGLADGPGLEGDSGVGTWIESAFDLRRFRGQSIRLRFLATTLGATFETWEEVNFWNPTAGDDGWWIDDVAIDRTLAIAATLVADDKDNSALPAPPADDVDDDGTPDACDNCANVFNNHQVDYDEDGRGDACDPCVSDPADLDDDLDAVCDVADNCLGVANPDQIDADWDGFGAACDCNEANGQIFPGATERNDGIDQSCDGWVDEISGTSGFFEPGDRETLSWDAQPWATSYEVARSDAPDFAGACVTFVTTAPLLVDATTPGSGVTFFYLVRALQPNTGSWGAASNGEERFPCER